MIQQPNLSPVPAKNQYCLLDDYECEYGDIKIVVPALFLFDGASVPFFAWISTYTPFHPDVMAAAIIHDWLFLTHQVDRKTADHILYDRLILNGANKIKAKLMYKGVRIGGGSHWKWNKKDIKKMQLLYVLIKKNLRFEEYRFPKEVLSV